VLLRLARRSADVSHLLAALDPARQLEADVDHVGSVARRPQDAGRNVRGVAGSLGVEHAHRHQLSAVGEPGEVLLGRSLADGDLLGDRSGDVRAVPVLVQRLVVAVDEVGAGDELAGVKIGARRKAGRLWRSGVSDPGVDDGDRRPEGARRAARNCPVPGLRDPDAAGRPEEVPLVPAPPARSARTAPVERAESRSRNPVRVGVGDTWVVAKLSHRVVDLDPGTELHNARASALEADDYLPGHERLAGGDPRQRCEAQHRAGERGAEPCVSHAPSIVPP
jgi:hypothetical protein